MATGFALGGCQAPAGVGEDVGETSTDGSTSGGTGTGTSGTGETSTTGGSESSGSSEEGCYFGGCDPDMPSGPAPCDIWDPGSCPDGQKCSAYATNGTAWDANGCFDVMGDGQRGDDCIGFGDQPGISGEDDCGQGLMCWDIDVDVGLGYCIAFCTGSADSPSCEGVACTTCAIYNDGVLPLCLAQCNPLLGGADCPNPNNACLPDFTNGGFVCVLDPPGMGPYGTECTYANSCAAGLYCAPADDVPGCASDIGCCSEMCDVTQPNTCTGAGGGQECVAFFEPGEEPCAAQDVGGCAIP